MTNEEERVRVAVEELLGVAEMIDFTEREFEMGIRELAADRSGVDFSKNRRKWKAFITDMITKYYESVYNEIVTKRSLEETKCTSSEAVRDSSSKKMKKTEEMEDIKGKRKIDDEENEEEARAGSKKPKYIPDSRGYHIICQLGGKEKVIVNKWNGKTLVHIQEYKERHGRQLAISQGLMLQAEHFEVLAEAANDIDRAISFMQRLPPNS